MNENIQIRIWANYKDFAEVTEKVPLRILPDNYGTLFSPDSFREISCENYHSFLYTPESICVNFHTLVPTNKLRTDRVVFSLAIRRGYRLEKNPAEVLSDIRRDFIAFINDKTIFFEVDNVNGIETKIIPQIEKWEDAINTVEQKEQMYINCRMDSNDISFVAYGNNNDFNAYMSEPARCEYSGNKIIFIASSDNKSAFLGRNYRELSVSPDFRPSFPIYLTDYDKTKEIASVSSVNEPINVRKQKQYYKPLELQGSLADNWTRWKVERCEDGIGFKLGIPFEAETKVYRLEFKNNLLKPFDKFRFRWGTVLNNVELILSGEEIGRRIGDELVEAITDQYALVGVNCVNNTIVIAWRERFQYSIAELRVYIKQIYQIDPRISISGKSLSKAENLEHKQWWDGEKKEYKVIIEDESGQYGRYECTMEKPINQIELNKLTGTKIRFFWREDIDVCNDNPIVFKLNDKEERVIKYWREEGQVVEFFKAANYEVVLNGYENGQYRVEKKDDGKSAYLRFVPTIRKKIKPIIVVGIVCFVFVLISLAGGYYVGNKLPCSYINPAIAYNDSISQYKIDSLKGVIKEAQNEMSILNDSIDNLNKQLLGKEEAQKRKTDGDINKAMNKLNTLEFTQKETINYVINVVNKDYNASRKNKNLEICDACNEALKLCGDRNKNINTLKNFMAANGKGNKLPETPKKALNDIVQQSETNGQYKIAYETSGSVGTIQGLIDKINKNLDIK